MFKKSLYGTSTISNHYDRWLVLFSSGNFETLNPEVPYSGCLGNPAPICTSWWKKSPVRITQLFLDFLVIHRNPDLVFQTLPNPLTV